MLSEQIASDWFRLFENMKDWKKRKRFRIVSWWNKTILWISRTEHKQNNLNKRFASFPCCLLYRIKKDWNSESHFWATSLWWSISIDREERKSKNSLFWFWIKNKGACTWIEIFIFKNFSYGLKWFCFPFCCESNILKTTISRERLFRFNEL